MIKFKAVKKFICLIIICGCCRGGHAGLEGDAGGGGAAGLCHPGAAPPAATA